jgi:hypothetical protein
MRMKEPRIVARCTQEQHIRWIEGAKKRKKTLTEIIHDYLDNMFPPTDDLH